MVQIKKAPRYYACEDGQIWDSQRQIFLPQCNRHKNMTYKAVTLLINGKYRIQSVHRLIAEAFIPNPENYPFVNHKDENPSNNNVDNLEWCNAKYNNSYGTRGIRCGLSQRNRKDCSKPVVQYDLNMNKIAEYPSAVEAYRKTNVGSSAICRVCNKTPRYHTAGGYVWEWA